MNHILPSVDTHSLANGLQLQTVEMHDLPIVSVAVMMRAGGLNETIDLAGLSYLTGSSLDAGTATSDIHTLAERIEYLGTTLHVSTMQDAVSIIISTASSHLEPVMEILGELLCTANFPEREVNRMRETQMASLAQMRDRPGLRASLALDHMLFGRAHSYGRPIIGLRDSVKRLTRPDVTAFFQRFYTAAGSRAIAAGDVTPERWTSLCTTFLGSWQRPAVIDQPPPTAKSEGAGKVFLIDRPSTPQAEIRVGGLAMQRNHPDYIAATMLNHILGGQFTSRLNTSLREERGFTYGAWSAFSALRTSGSFTMGGAFHTTHADEALRVAFDEVRRLSTGEITQQELEYARHSMSGNFLRSFETPSQICGRLQALYAYDLAADYYHDYMQQLNRVTQEDILRTARQWLDTERFAVVVVGDASSLGAKLEQLSLGEVVRYDDA